MLSALGKFLIAAVRMPFRVEEIHGKTAGLQVQVDRIEHEQIRLVEKHKLCPFCNTLKPRFEARA